MDSRYEAHALLNRAVQDAHQFIAVVALQSIGAEISCWQDVTEQSTKITKLVNTYKAAIGDYEENDDNPVYSWGISSVLYDPGIKRPTYQVPLLGHTNISLITSATPLDLVGRSTVGQENLQYVMHPVKYIHVELQAKNTAAKNALVYIGPDMPATAVHGDDVRYVQKMDPDAKEYYLHGTNTMSLVEKNFGPDALEVLSGETCTALSKAITAARKEPITLSNYQHEKYLY